MRDSIAPRPALVLFAAALFASGCGGGSGDPGPIDPDPGGPIKYSAQIQSIWNRSCLVGCHSTAVASDGLDMSSWEATIKGSKFGEALIPYRSDQSHLIDHLTGVATPRMPLSRDPLSPGHINLIKRWIDEGARNDAGEVPYETSRRKIYVANQGTDEVSVLDLDALVVFRIVSVGNSPNLEGPHNIWIENSPAKRYWYVTLINSGQLEQYDTATDSLRARVAVGSSPANGVTSLDGSRVYVTRWEDGPDRFGKVVVVDAATMTVVDSIVVGGRPHGIGISPDGTTLFTTNYYTDDVSVVDLTLPRPVEIGRIKVDPNSDPLTPAQYQPNEVIVSPDGARLYVTMFAKAEVRVLDVESESVLAVIPTGGTGFLEDLSPTSPELYVADWGATPGGGAGRTISIISTSNLGGPATILSDPSISRPHGIAFSPDGDFAFVTNENVTGAAPPHHPTQGGGLNGNIMVIDTATRSVVKVVELEPFSAGIAVLF